MVVVAAAGVALLASVGRSGRDGVEAQQPSPTPKPTVPTGRAQPSTDPRNMLVAELDPRLRAGAADVFAGLYGAPDGAVQVFVTEETPAVRSIVASSEASVRAAAPAGRPVPAVRIVPGKANSLAELERIRDALRARRSEFRARGIELTGFGANIAKNKTEIGVKTLTPQIKADLGREFGADKIDVSQQDYAQFDSRSADIPPYLGGLPITKMGGGMCTSGFNIEKDGRTYVTTAGHCDSSVWSHNGTVIGGTQTIHLCE